MITVQEYLASTELFEVFDLTDDELEILDEATGALAGLNTHLKKLVTSHMGGENSAVTETGRLSNKSGLHRAILAGMEKGHVVVVHKNGKPVAAVHPASNYGSRPEFGIHNGESKETQTERKLMHGTGKWNPRLKRHIPSEYSTHQNPNYTKGDALSRAMGLAHGSSDGDKDHYKEHHIEVKTFAPDQNRISTAKKRNLAAPKMQANYVNKNEAEKAKDKSPYASDKKQTSTTPAGKMDDIVDTAAKKLAKKTLGDKGSPAEKAKQLHAEIGKHIEAGDHKAAREKMSELDDHIRSQGLGKENGDIESYASALADLQRDKKNGYGGYSKERLKRIRDRAEGKRL
jgi:hypothetical protein